MKKKNGKHVLLGVKMPNSKSGGEGLKYIQVIKSIIIGFPHLPES